MMRKYLSLVILSALSLACFADNVAPDAYEVLLKNKNEVIEHDGCDYPDSDIESRTGKVKLGHAFHSIFDGMMLDNQDMLIFKGCMSQGEHGWLCSITFNNYFRDIKEESPSPFNMTFSVDTSLNLVHDLKLVCM